MPLHPMARQFRYVGLGLTGDPAHGHYRYRGRLQDDAYNIAREHEASRSRSVEVGGVSPVGHTVSVCNGNEAIIRTVRPARLHQPENAGYLSIEVGFDRGSTWT